MYPKDRKKNAQCQVFLQNIHKLFVYERMVLKITVELNLGV